MASPLIISDVAALPEYEGHDLGTTDWRAIEQAQIDAFAAATGDRQWIHVDRKRAERESRFGTTIAHGYLTLALAPVLLPDLLVVQNCSQIVNYGIDRLRLREPVPSGSRVRLAAGIKNVRRVRLAASIKNVRRVRGGAMRLTLAIRFEVEDAKRPACSGELIFVYFP
jgi:acyl dehydratase